MHGHTDLKAVELPETSWAPRGQSWYSLAARVHPISLAREQSSQGASGQPQSQALGTGTGLNPAGMCVHMWAWLIPYVESMTRAGPWEVGDRPCSITGAGADTLKG